MLLKFKELYSKHVVENLQKKFEYANKHQMPKLSKIVINMGVGDAVLDSKVINFAISDLTAISGQKPYTTYAKKSIATCNIKRGSSVYRDPHE